MKKTLLTALILSAGCLLQAQTTAPLIHVTLLGTGVPLLNASAIVANNRALSGLLVEAGGERMLFDCGQGIYMRLLQSGGSVMSPNIAVDKLFISHLHSDHIGDLAALYSLGALYRYATPTSATADVPLRVWGPPGSPNQPVGTWAMMQNFRSAYDTDFYVRIDLFSDPGDIVFTWPAVETEFNTIELWDDVVYSHNGVTVTAFQVDHHPVEPAYGFRVDYQGHSVVYSGDTTLNQNLINHSKNVDVLIHEVYGWARSASPEIFDYHTSPEEAAQVFNMTTPKQAVFTHLVIPPGTTANDLVTRTRTAGYTGPLTPGVDLMTIDVTASGVTITPPATGMGINDVKETGIPLEIRNAQLRRHIE